MSRPMLSRPAAIRTRRPMMPTATAATYALNAVPSNAERTAAPLNVAPSDETNAIGMEGAAGGVATVSAVIVPGHTARTAHTGLLSVHPSAPMPIVTVQHCTAASSSNAEPVATLPAVPVAQSAAAAPAATAMNSGLNAVPISSSPSVAQRCHTDALHCIFAFLSLSDLLASMHSCRDWHTAGLKLPPLHLNLRMGGPAQGRSLAALVASPWCRHFTSLTCTSESESEVMLRVDQLRMLRALPHLNALDACLDVADLRAAARSQPVGEPRELIAQLLRDALPLHLCSLTVRLSYAPPVMQAVIDALPVLSALRTLQLHTATPDLDLSPLIRLSQLSDLRLPNCPSLPQCAVIKQLSPLSALDLGARSGWNRAALTALLEPPHSLQRLREVSMAKFETLDPPLLALLLQLPALTTLRAGILASDCWAGLGVLSQLRTLHLKWLHDFTATQRTALGNSLHSLPRLSDLSISLHSDTRAGGSPLALRLPALRSLHLSGVRLPSLSFLQHSPLLERLSLSGCAEMTADDTLHCLQSFAPRLRSLDLHHCVRLSVGQTMRLRPPFASLPALVHFSIQPRQGGA